jgi:putative oxidoreductase
MIPERYAPQLYALMRIVFGLVFLMYGVQKFGMLGGVNGQGASVPIGSWPYGVAGPIELVVGVLLIIGLLTPFAAFIGAGEMAVAYFMNHFPVAPLPVQNMGVPAVLFCFGFLYIAARGAGIWSVDAARGGSANRRSASV